MYCFITFPKLNREIVPACGGGVTIARYFLENLVTARWPYGLKTITKNAARPTGKAARLILPACSERERRKRNPGQSGPGAINLPCA
jgi:hypothetical protein